MSDADQGGARIEELRRWLKATPLVGPPNPGILRALMGLSNVFLCWAQGASGDARIERWELIELLQTSKLEFEGSVEAEEVLAYAEALPKFDHQQMLFRLSERLWKQVVEGSGNPG